MSDREAFQAARDAGLKKRHEQRLARARSRMEPQTLTVQCPVCGQDLAIIATPKAGDRTHILLTVDMSAIRLHGQEAHDAPRVPATDRKSITIRADAVRTQTTPPDTEEQQ